MLQVAYKCDRIGGIQRQQEQESGATLYLKAMKVMWVNIGGVQEQQGRGLVAHEGSKGEDWCDDKSLKQNTRFWNGEQRSELKFPRWNGSPHNASGRAPGQQIPIIPTIRVGVLEG
jgi:hypothetical protein